MNHAPHDDVRMRGFHTRITLEEARERVRKESPPLGTVEEVPLREASGRVLIGGAVALRPVPAFDRSAMDGYAVAAKGTFGATPYDPVVLELLGASLPGRPCEESLSGARAVRIMTGAPMPAGADAVVPAEMAEEERGLVRVSAAVPPGKNVSRAGEDIEQGATPVPAGRTLRPQDLGVLASLGFDSVRVAPRPRVGILATGDEIVKAGARLGDHQVYDANTPMLAGLVRRWGGRPGAQSLQPDEVPRIRRALGRLVRNTGVDLVLVTGGTSVGEEDHAPSVLREIGRLVFHGVAVRPASPVAFGIAEGKPVFLLPGNPVSSLCAFDLLVGPALRRLQGIPPLEPYASARLPLARRLASVAGRADSARVAVTREGVIPLAVAGASILSSATRADGYVVVPADVEGLDEGDLVEVFLY